MGIMTYDNNRIYEGEWSNGMRDGQGFEIFSNGN